MPCRDGGPTIEERNFQAWALVNDLQAMLCLCCNVITQSSGLPLSECLEEANDGNDVHDIDQLEDVCGVTTAEIQEWWDKHREQDEKREASELAKLSRNMRKRAALAKLDPDERELLGLEDEDA